MKFGKQFEMQQVPEWRDTYVDYKQLKKILKKIQQLQSESVESFKVRAGSSLKRLLSTLSRTVSLELENDTDILILAEPHEGEIVYQTSFLGVDDENEITFFDMLDTELTKVNRFYDTRLKELLEQASAMDKQMEALVIAQSFSTKDVSNSGSHNDDDVDVDVMKQMKIDVPPEKPSDALVWLLSELAKHKSLVNLTAVRKLKKAKEMLRQAFVEFYKGLCILKNFCSLNLIAFSKILKKYDKVTSRNLAQKYLELVERSYIGTSDQVQKLMHKVERVFIEHFSNFDRRQAMRLLRPEAREEKHRITFSMGVFTGLSIALTIALSLIIREEKIRAFGYSRTYMKAVFPIFSMLVLILFHLFLYGVNIYMWRKTGINHTFILGLRPKSELKFRDVFFLVTFFSTLALCGLILHLEVTAGENCCEADKEAIPLIFIAGMVCLLFLPLNMLYRSSRVFFLGTLGHCLLTPLYKVDITDFLLADHLTSQVQALRDFEYVLCYYGGGFFRTRDSDACLNNTTFIRFGFAVALLPYWCRFIQCLRRWHDEKRTMHIFNAMKYMSAIVAVALRLVHTYHKTSALLGVTIAVSALATFVATYWDVVHDWGLLRRSSTNPWLRDKLAIKSKAVYFLAMAANVLLRFAWLQALLDIRVSGVHPRLFALLIACLEVFRRGQWNYFRIENEHFNNVGQYRAVNSVPLPFVDSDE